MGITPYIPGLSIIKQKSVYRSFYFALSAPVLHIPENKDIKEDIKSPSVLDMLPSTSDSIVLEQPSQEFKLAPTPAQLGKAPLQRRQSMGKFESVSALNIYIWLVWP